MPKYDVPDSPKSLKETLCLAQAAIHELAERGYNRDNLRTHTDRLQRLITECDRHRPVGPDGVHGDRHTITCGCSAIWSG